MIGLERLAIGAGLVAALVFGAYLYGRDSQREEMINAQLRHEIKVITWQRKGTIIEVIKWLKVKEKHDANMPALARDIVRNCLLSSGVALRTGTDGTGVPEDGTRAVGENKTTPDEVNRAWCEQLAADYAAGVENTDSLGFVRGWVEANGGAPDD